jgi:hypothetical protein
LLVHSSNTLSSVKETDLTQALSADDTPAELDPINVEILDVLREVKVLARRYYQLTGKPLGITGG